MCRDNGAILFNIYQAPGKQYAYSSFVFLCMIVYGMDMKIELIEFYLESFTHMGFRDYQDLVFSFRDKRKYIVIGGLTS